jgi:hypothetical protein
MNTATGELRAYHGDEKLKEETVAKARWHKDFSEFVRDEYFSKNGKAKVCAVGCITEDPNGGHHLYPSKWGIPEWLAYLEERIFTGLPDEKMAAWPERFLDAIPVGADFEGLADRLAIRRLKEECLPLSGHCPESIRVKAVASIEQTVAALEGKGDREAARSAAESAAWSAWSAAWSAESAAWSAWSAAWSAARSAARSAESAARSAESAARSAAESAARSAAASAAWSAAFEREADRLVAELEALPVTGVEAG